MTDVLYIPHWRAGTSRTEDISDRTHLFLTNISSVEATLALTLFGTDGRPWANQPIDIEDYARVYPASTDGNGAVGLRLSPGATVRIELNSESRVMGYALLQLMEIGRGGGDTVFVLARGEVDTFASEQGTGFEMSTSTITITGATPAALTL
jgi:hypothetical protein